MIRRYDLRRSDNYPHTEKISVVCSGSGEIIIDELDFPVTSAMVTFSTLPLVKNDGLDFSSSSSSSLSSETESDDMQDLPRIYVSEYTETGFIVKYENIPEEVGYIEFTYIAH